MEQQSNDKLPLVSVVMIAYNLEDIIGEAIESVVNQKTKYSIELVIGEDKSTDQTKKVIEQYAKKYPKIIKPIYNDKNLGLTPNFINTHNQCTGDYIALLDGDDYWTDNKKIEIQVDFLEKNKDYAGCSHQSQIIFDDIKGNDSFFGSTEDGEYSLNDTLGHRKFHTSSLIYRRKIWTNSGGIPSTILSNERAIYPMVAIFGKIKYYGHSMCVYRKSTIGISARVTIQELQKDLDMIPWLKNLSSDFPSGEYRSFLHLSTYSYSINKPFLLVLKHYFLFTIYSFSYFPKNLGDLKYGTFLAFQYIFKLGRKKRK